MFRLPQKQKITPVYTNHKYRAFRSFASFVNKSEQKKPQLPSSNQGLFIGSPQVSRRRALTPRKGHARISTSQIPSSNVFLTDRPNISMKRCLSTNNAKGVSSRESTSHITINQNMLIAPPVKKFQYCITDSDANRMQAKILTCNYLLQPCKINSIPIRSPTGSRVEKQVEKELKIRRQKKEEEKNKSEGKRRKLNLRLERQKWKEVNIEPWDFSEEQQLLRQVSHQLQKQMKL